MQYGRRHRGNEMMTSLRQHNFYSRDAVHKRLVSVRLAVCLSHAGTVSKWLNLS